MQAKPFLKWAGGKRQLLPELLKHVPEKIRTYREPFLGGGALFFALADRLTDARLSDANAELVTAYDGIKHFDLGRIESLLRHHESTHSREHFRSVREARDLPWYAATARMIYLNRAGFNGLYRVNKSGQFNVPWGKRETVSFDYDNLRACSSALQSAQVFTADFRVAIAEAQDGDFVYCDPPYVPNSETANFTTYTRDGFTLEDQHALKRCALAAKERGANVLLSNSDTWKTREIYEGWNMRTVQARRSINRDGAKRGPVGELLIW